MCAHQVYLHGACSPCICWAQRDDLKAEAVEAGLVEAVLEALRHSKVGNSGFLPGLGCTVTAIRVCRAQIITLFWLKAHIIQPGHTSEHI